MREDLTRWTIRMALAAGVGAIMLRIRTKWAIRGLAQARSSGGRIDSTFGQHFQRGLWTLGCMLSWAHVASALAYYHHWSHDDAYSRTARETANTVGIDWGGGIFFNYLFLLLWTFDVAWWWWSPGSYQVPRRTYSILLYSYLAFIAFNATVVFGHGAVRYFGIAVMLGLVWVAWFFHFGRQARNGTTANPSTDPNEKSRENQV